LSTSTGPSASHADRAAVFARLFEDVHEGIYVGVLAGQARDRDATQSVNAALRRMFRYAAGTPDSEIQPFAPARFADASVRAVLLEQLRHGATIRESVVRMRRMDRSEFDVEITAHAEPKSEGLTTIVALLRDASERAILAERQRELQLQENAHAERLAALGYALSSVAHELNNPLATIIGWAERIAEAPFAETTREGAPMMLREAQRAARIVRNLLTLSRKRPSTRMRLDVNQIIRETLALRAHDQRALRISVTAALTPVLPSVFVNGHQIQQVLLNLIINAEQAMMAAHGKGALIIRSAFDENRQRVRIDIIDDGPVVPDAVKDRIFDPFFTTKAAGEGTGLGLTVAHAIVRDHGGQITVTGAPNGGAAFTVELPVAAQSPQAAPGN
jgi:signal transduction histidine kinase